MAKRKRRWASRDIRKEWDALKTDGERREKILELGTEEAKHSIAEADAFLAGLDRTLGELTDRTDRLDRTLDLLEEKLRSFTDELEGIAAPLVAFWESLPEETRRDLVRFAETRREAKP